MAIRKFLTSVADVFGYDANDNIVFVAKTLLDSSIEASLGSQPVRGGRGNQLQYVYYHTGELNVTLTDTQWNLGMLAATVGDTLAGGDNYYKEISFTISGSTGTLPASAQDALAFTGTSIYGWVTDPNGTTHKATFSTARNFTLSGSVSGTGDSCLRYYVANATSGQGITIKANMIPQVLKVVMEAQLNSADVTSNKIGMVQIVIPRLQLSGAFSISMTADGIANTPLTGMALAYSDSVSAGCLGDQAYYATIVEIIDNTNWYDNVIALAVEGGDFTLPTTLGTSTLSVWAVPSTGPAFKVSNSLLDFTSSASAKATVGLHTGLVTGVAAESAIIDIAISSASANGIDGTVIVTVP